MRTSLSLLWLLLIAVSAAAVYSSRYRFQDERSASSSLENVVSVHHPISNDIAGTEMQRLSSKVEPTMDELVELAKQLLAHMQSNVRDYTATLVKRERIAGTLTPEARMQIKIRNPQVASESKRSDQAVKGLAAYIKFTEPTALRGREVIWEAGKNDNKLVAHEAGFLNVLRVELEPTGTLAMMGSKYPITEIGLLRLVEKMLEKIDRGADLSACKIETREGERVGDRQCRFIQVTQPRSVPGADFFVAQFFLDTERQMPLRYAAYLWPKKDGDPPLLEEEYTYLDLKLNVGLEDADFDPDNPAYDYP